MILRLDRETESWYPLPSPPLGPKQIAMNNESVAWFMSGSGKIYQLKDFELGEWQLISTPSSAISIAGGPGSLFWVVLNSGIYLYDSASVDSWKPLPALPNGLLATQVGGWSETGAISLASDSNVYIYNGENWQLLDLDLSISLIAVSTLGPDFWFATQGNLLTNMTFQDGRWIPNHLVDKPSPTTTSIAVGGLTDLWAVTQSNRVFALVNTAAPHIDDLANWMSRIPDIEHKRLMDVTLPATHDTATYEVTASMSDSVSKSLREWWNTNFSKSVISGILADIAAIWAMAQSKSTLEQLQDGIRILDLRPSWFNARGKFFNRHTFYTVEFESVLKDIRSFLESTERELIIVDTADFDQTLVKNKQKSDELVALITKYLDEYLVESEVPGGGRISPTQLMNMTIGDLTRNGSDRVKSRVIFFYNNAFLGDNPKFFENSSRFYAGGGVQTTDANTLMKALRDFLGEAPPEELISLSWVPGPSEQQIRDDIPRFLSPKYQLRDLAKDLNPQLPAFLKDKRGFNPNARINKIEVDWYQTSDAVDLAIALTLKNALLNSFSSSIRVL